MTLGGGEEGLFKKIITQKGGGGLIGRWALNEIITVSAISGNV